MNDSALEHAGPAAEETIIWAVQWLELGIETMLSNGPGLRDSCAVGRWKGRKQRGDA